MKREIGVLALLLWLLLTHFSAAQEIIELGHLFEDKSDTWYEVSFQCSELVPCFYEKGAYDSLSYILQYWEEETGVLEPVRRAWRLTQMSQNKFDPDLLGNVLVDDFINYLNQLESQSDTTHWTTHVYGQSQKQPYISKAFNQFTTSLANDLLGYTDLSDDEYLICLFYAHRFDTFFSLIQSGEARYTSLYRRIQNYKKELTKTDAHYGLFVGYWSPRKSFQVFGEKAHLGGTIGLNVDRAIFDFTFLLQFPESRHLYTVKYNDELFETKHYVKIYFGIEPGYKLYDWGHTHVNLFAGAGIDILEAVPESENPYEEAPISFVAPNLSLGIGLQHYLKKGEPYYLYYQLRYEYSGYDTDGGTDLSDGEAVSIRLGFAWDANVRKHEFRKYFD